MKNTNNYLAAKALHKNHWTLEDINGLTVLRSALLSDVSSLTHVFTTRIGGQSRPPLNWFNLEQHWEINNAKQDALNNRKKLCEAFSLNFKRLTVPLQRHTTNIAWLEGKLRLTDKLNNTPEQGRSYDGVATLLKEEAILLMFADCVPIILFDKEKRVLCMLHAGWRGTAGGIATKGVELLKQKSGCQPEHILAAIGPCIGSCCYETGEDVAQQLCQSVKDPSELIVRKDNRPYPDLKAINAMQLLEAGLQQIDTSSWCTACHPEIFYSYRHSQGKTGRQGALACLT